MRIPGGIENPCTPLVFCFTTELVCDVSELPITGTNFTELVHCKNYSPSGYHCKVSYATLTERISCCCLRSARSVMFLGLHFKKKKIPTSCPPPFFILLMLLLISSPSLVSSAALTFFSQLPQSFLSRLKVASSSLFRSSPAAEILRPWPP